MDIQKAIDNAAAYGEVKLPSGEFEGPFRITKPCSVVGNATTLWAKEGPALSVESKGVSLTDLRIEITGNPSNKASFIALSSRYNDVALSEVEVYGDVIGVDGEDGPWDIPRVIALGSFAAGQQNTFYCFFAVNAQAEILNGINGISVQPQALTPGHNKLIITTDSMKENTIIYGEILFRSKLLRRAFLTGRSEASPPGFRDGSIVYGEEPANYREPISSPPKYFDYGQAELKVPELARGQRISLSEFSKGEISVVYFHDPKGAQIDVDAYAFMLYEGGKVRGDDDLVFFGNAKSADNSVKCEGRTASVDMPNVSPDCQRIAIVYSIYQGSAKFSQAVNPRVDIYSGQILRFRFALSEVKLENTLVAVELYRRNDEWKMSAVGSGYNDGLIKLCAQYGLSAGY